MEKKDPLKNLKPYPPGVSGNPAGRAKQFLTQDKIMSVIGKFADMTSAQLEEILKSPKSSMLEITVASILAKAAETGDYSRLEFLFSRSVGKVKEQLEVTAVKPYLIQRADGSVLELGAKTEKDAE